MNLRDELDSDVHAWKKIFTAWDRHGYLDRATLGIDSRSQAVDCPGSRFGPRGLGKKTCHLARLQSMQLLLGYVHPGHDGIEIDNIEQMLIDRHLVADVYEPLGNRSLDRGSHFCIGEFSLGVPQSQFQLLQSMGRFGIGLFADQLLLPQVGLPVVFPFGLGKLAFYPRHFGALSFILKADEELTLLDVVALLHQQPSDLTLCLGDDLDLVLGL